MTESSAKRGNRAWLLTILSLACCSSVFSVSARPSPPPLEHYRGPSRRLDIPMVVNLRDYGAQGNGLADDGPALQQALNALASAGGGTLVVPAGSYKLETPVLRQFAPTATLTIAGVPSSTPIDVAPNGSGLDLTSEFIIAVGATNYAIHLAGLDSLLLKDVSFVGVQEVEDDARVVLALSSIKQATVQHSEFYGLASLLAGGAILAADGTDLKLQQSAFLGCATSSGVGTSVVQNTAWRGISVTDCKFVDYGLRPDFYSKTPLSPPYSWINVGNGADLEPTGSRREAIFDNVFLDEGGFIAISARPEVFATTYPPYEVYMSRLFVNVNNLGSNGVYVSNARKVFIDRSHFGWSHNAGFAIYLDHVGDAVLDLIDCSDDATRIGATAERLTVINSVYTSLDSPGPTRIITTDTPEEDPAQYVRQQYLTVLNQDPDPAGHYYWTDEILRCQADLACVGRVKAALAVYLNDSPPAKFSASGRVVDENGVPLAAVTVSLTGSQSVAMQTDSNGNFAFTNLASAGSYVLTPTRNHYVLQSLALVTPTSDRTTNFTGTLIRHTIAGRVTASTGQVLAGAILTLSGTQNAITTSDAAGNYSFPNLGGGGNYTVTVSRSNYTFAQPIQSFVNLSANQTTNFTAELNPGVPVILTTSDSTRALALDSVLRTSEPFDLTFNSGLAEGRHTRLILFATNFVLTADEETTTNLSVNLEDASGRIYPLRVEYAGVVQGFNWLNSIVVRLSNDLTDVGDVKVWITYRGATGDPKLIGIGHIGAGP